MTARCGWIALVVCASVAPAVDSGVMRGPLSGYVLDARSRSLRPVNGIPGGASLGTPVRLGFAVDRAVISAEYDYAVVTALRSAPVPKLVRGLSSEAPAVTELPGAMEATGMELSDDGTALLLTSGSPARLQLVTGLPGNPVATAAVDLSGWSGGVVAAAAGPAGDQVVAAAGDGSVYLFTARNGSLGDPQWIGSIPGAIAVSFAGTDAAVVGSSTSGDVMIFSGLSGAPAISRLAGAADGIQSVRALRSAGPQSVCVADGVTGQAGVIDLRGQGVHWFAAAQPASRCERLNGSAMALNEAGRQPLLILDTSGPAALFFVPVN